MQKLYQRSMFHLLRVKGQLVPALQAKVTVVEVISAHPTHLLPPSNPALVFKHISQA